MSQHNWYKIYAFVQEQLNVAVSLLRYVCSIIESLQAPERCIQTVYVQHLVTWAGFLIVIHLQLENVNRLSTVLQQPEQLFLFTFS